MIMYKTGNRIVEQIWYIDLSPKDTPSVRFLSTLFSRVLFYTLIFCGSCDVGECKCIPMGYI